MAVLVNTTTFVISSVRTADTSQTTFVDLDAFAAKCI